MTPEGDPKPSVGGRSQSTRRERTSTSAFGVSRRESHDSSDFYARFTLPTISSDELINRNSDEVLDEIHWGDSRRMHHVLNNSVALVVTSPPYFSGKEYERDLGSGEVPATYVDYLELLYDVFGECRRVLEPGGRIAINVANLGRKPYRSLAADVIDILQNRLGLLLRGEIVWVKGQGISGSCAWGSYGSPANPVLRDLTERIIVASKGRFDRALSRKERERQDLPFGSSMRKDDFIEFTQDVWDFHPENAHRVNHPAPFPVELPHRLIDLYTYLDDVVLDPFMGSGSTAVAAFRAGRRFIGYDLEHKYVLRARERLQIEKAESHEVATKVIERPQVHNGFDATAFQARAVSQGRRAKQIARELLEQTGFRDIVEKVKLRNGVEVNFLATDRRGNQWMFDVSGAFTSSRPGLKRTDTLWKALGKAAVIRSIRRTPLILLTTDLPEQNSSGFLALRSARGTLFHDAIEMFSLTGIKRLTAYASGKNRVKPIGELLTPKR